MAIGSTVTMGKKGVSSKKEKDVDIEEKLEKSNPSTLGASN